MGWSFRKSFRIMPGVRMNLSRRGVGWSFGFKGFRIGTSGGRTRVSSGVGPFRYQKTVSQGADQKSGGLGCFSFLIIGLGAMSVLAIINSPEDKTSDASSKTPLSPVSSSATTTTKAVRPADEVLRLPDPPSSEAPSQRTSGSAVPRALPTGPAAEAARWRAVARYPYLGVAGSPLNKAFIDRVRRYQVERPSFFDQAEWPTLIATECQAELTEKAPSSVAR